MNELESLCAGSVAALEFDETSYRAWNPDVDAAVRSGALESGQLHFERFGRRENRPPYGAPPGCCGAPPFRVGDEIRQPVQPSQDWWAGVFFSLGTEGRQARVVFDCAVLLAATGEAVRSFRFDEWVSDGERQVLKFPPLEQSRGVAFVLRLVVNTLEARRSVQLNCERAATDDGLEWNGSPPAAVRGVMELLYTPLTLVGPAGITLNPLTHCAGGCIHCLARVHQKKPGRLKREWIEALRAHFRDGPGVAWCLDYATDFFKVARWRPELIDLIAAKGHIAINTEGQHVTEDALRRLFAGGLNKIGFSCDAATEETYAIIRPGLGRLQTVLDSARLALQLRHEAGRAHHPCIALTMVVMRANLHEVVAFVELAARLGVDAAWFNHLWVCSEEMLEESVLFTPSMWRRQLAAAQKRGRELGIDVRTGVDIQLEHPQDGISWCPEPWSAMVVLGNGDVLACASPVSKIGSLCESSIEEIWNGEAFQQLRRSVNSERPPLMCQHCFVYRKPGNADGVFMHHLIDDYDLRRDLADATYADQFRDRFSFARHQASRTSTPGEIRPQAPAQ